MEKEKRGSVRVGRCYYKGSKMVYPSYEGYTKIVVMLKSHSKYYPLSPYFLKDDRGRILENIWQFSKCYEKVPKVTLAKSRFDKTVVWTHQAETHLDSEDNITDEYKAWREKGMNNDEPVRYPVGYNYRHHCKFALAEKSDGTISKIKLDYISSRKNIYLHLYGKLVRKEPYFAKLLDRLHKGENLLIIEVDGPHEESMEYYKENYEVPDNFIEKDTILVTDENMKIMLNDEKHPCGHGYCLGMALMNIDKKKSVVK